MHTFPLNAIFLGFLCHYYAVSDSLETRFAC